MKTFHINILNSKVTKLLKVLVDLKLNAINPKGNDFAKVIAGFRERAAANGDFPSTAEITAEVEVVRAERYAKR
jgi:hypothetical protein